MTAPHADSKFCKKCARKPELGVITDRLNKPNWEAPDGKTPLRYVQVWTSKKDLMKAGVSRSQVYAEAAKFGLKVPNEQWTKPERRSRSRKLKSPIADSSDSEPEQAASATSSPKTPKKPTKPASTNAPKRPSKKSKIADEPAINTTPTESNEADNAKTEAVSTPEAQPEPQTETVDLVARSLAQELVENPYDAETEDEDDQSELPDLCLFVKQVDLQDGNGPTKCYADIDNNIYDLEQELIGMIQSDKFVPMSSMNRTHSGSKQQSS